MVATNTRFLSTFLMLITYGVLVELLDFAIPRLPVIASLPILLLVIVIFNSWAYIHGAKALHTYLRAHFDEANVLATYQPRARTEGHLFQPDPPTPAPGRVAFADDLIPEARDEDPERAAFRKARDQHYANEFQRAQQLARENMCELQSEPVDLVQPQPTAPMQAYNPATASNSVSSTDNSNNAQSSAKKDNTPAGEKNQQRL